VEVITVIERDTPIFSDWIATLDGYVNAQIQPRVSGYIVKQNYREEAMVRKGDVLFEIDPRIQSGPRSRQGAAGAGGSPTCQGQPRCRR